MRPPTVSCARTWATKQSGGSPFDRAGLTNGTPFVVAAAAACDRCRLPGGATARAHRHASRCAPLDWNSRATAQNAEARAKGLKPQPDRGRPLGPGAAGDQYFLTTEGGASANTPTGRLAATAAASGGCGSTTSSDPSSAAR